MSTQLVRNILSTQIDSVLNRAKQELRNEGKKKISEVQNELPTSDDIISKLQTDASPDACSEKGKQKQDKKYQKIIDKLDGIQNVVKSALEKIENIEEKIKPIKEETGPISEIKGFVDLLKATLLPILNIAILAVPLVLAALTGPAANAKAADAASQKRDKAASKVKEYNALIQSVPLMLQHYMKKVAKLFLILLAIKTSLKAIIDLISKLKLFAFAKVLETEDYCDDLNNKANNSVGNANNPLIPDPNGPTELENYMAFLNDNYKDVYDKLQSSNNKKSLERIFTLKENLEEDFNISFKIINIEDESN